MNSRIRSMVRSYLETALWSTPDCDESGNMTGNFDDDYSVEDFSAEALAQAESDCAAFLDSVNHWVADHDSDQIGHDFWLTRNGHGAGFWDGDYKHGNELTRASKPWGSVDIYVGSDGKLHLS